MRNEENNHVKKLAEQESSKSDMSQENKMSKSGKPDVRSDENATDNTAETKGAGKEESKPKSKMLAKLQAKMAALAAKKGIQAMIQMQIMKMMYMFLQMMYTALMNAAAAVAHAVLAVMQFFTTIGTAIVNAVTAVATFLGGGAVAMATAAVTVIGAPVLVVAAVAVVVINVTTVQNVARSDVAVDSCDESKLSELDDEFVDDVDAKQLEIAQNVWSVLSSAGIPDVNIAGVLGNWQAESGLDPTSIEGIYGESYNVTGTKKKNAIANLSSYTTNTLGKTSSGYHVSGDTYYCGLGIGQFTGSNAQKLMDMANRLGTEWYDLDTQLIFSLKPTSDGGYRNFLPNWTNEENSPVIAANEFMLNWEGLPAGHTSLTTRQRYASNWYARMAEWTVNTTYARTILDKVASTEDVALSNSEQQIKYDCNIYSGNYDNTNIANAAVLMAYKTLEESKGNEGTPLYMRAHDVCDIRGYEGHVLYQSCDRGVGTIVRWSGADDSAPCCLSIDYWRYSDKWMELPEGWTRDDLQPGDVMVWKNCCHIFVYVGHEIIEQRWPDLTDEKWCCVDSGFHSKHSLAVRSWDDTPSYVFRNVKRETDSKYVNAIPPSEVAQLVAKYDSGTWQPVYRDNGS